MATYLRALNTALDHALADDERVCIMGEDVAAGGAFGATRGLLDAHGPARVRNTPISEAAIVGLATGAAASGLRPVVEVMFIDFMTLAMDPLVNHAAKLRFMSGGQVSVPLVLRTQSGAIGGAAAQHSQSLEAWFCHVPGLKVVSPTTPHDVYGLMRSAIDDDNPVVFVEPKSAYTVRGDLPEPGTRVPLGSAAVRRAGDDVTIVAYGSSVAVAEDAAVRLGDHAIEAEVIDLRSLVPFDLPTVLGSVARTSRVLVVHEAATTAGFGAEIVARIIESGAIERPRAIGRLGAFDVPIAASPTLEAAGIPDAERIVAAVEGLVADGRVPDAVVGN